MPLRLRHLLGRRVLVTGANGFLGAAIRQVAIEAGAQVHCLTRGAIPPSTAGAGTRSSGWWQADLTDPASLHHVLSEVRPELVLHAAGHSSAERHLGAVAPSLRDNVMATVNLLSVSATLGTVRRVVLAGSIDSPRGSADTVAPASAYAASKLVESIYGRMFHRTYGLDVVEARVAVVYGPGQQRPKKLFPHLIGKLLRGEVAELTSGSRIADWTYLADAATAFALCGVAEGIAGHAVDIGTGMMTSVADVARRLAHLVGRPDLLRLGALPDRDGEPERGADAESTARILNWRAAVDLDLGLQRTIDWYRQTLSAPKSNAVSTSASVPAILEPASLVGLQVGALN
jgi:nucleoside-diphosphate-sugar epimerase